MKKQGVFQYLKSVFKQNGMIGKLILVNAVIFAIIQILYFIQGGYAEGSPGIFEKAVHYLSGPGDPSNILQRPWGVFTQMFTHYNFMHFLFNMIFLFFVGQIMIQLLGEKRLLFTYILGGLFAYATHVVMFYLIPEFAKGGVSDVVGASGSVMAIFCAVAFMRPKLTVYFFGMIKMPIIVLAIVYIAVDLFSVNSSDGVAHFAHLGGALFGALSIINVNSPNNFMNRFEKFWKKLGGLFNRKPKMKLHQQEEVQKMDDDEYRAEKIATQKRVDAILDKISKKGYEALTKEEKEILFNESKRK